MEQTTPPPQTPKVDPNKGKVLADTYRITRLMGEGGMGKVYEAGHLRLSKKRYAVKLLQSGAAEDAEAYARFRREAEIATEIGHPHIVDVHDFNVTAEGQPFMVMEFLEGEDLFDYTKRIKRLPRQDLVRIMNQVAGALKAAHDRGVVHRDLKPENIFLTWSPEGEIQVKLLDFGLSKIKHNQSRLTKQNAVFGTPHYMSPEQANGQVEDVDHRTDIFALGVIVYQCLTGELPFEAPTQLGVLYKVCNDPFLPLTEVLPELPVGLNAVLEKALAKSRSDRYQNAQEFVQDLIRALDQTAPSARRLRAGPSTPAIETPTPAITGPAVETPTPMVARRDSQSRVSGPRLTASPRRESVEHTPTEPKRRVSNEPTPTAPTRRVSGGPTPTAPTRRASGPRPGQQVMTAPKGRVTGPQLPAAPDLPPGAPPVPDDALAHEIDAGPGRPERIPEQDAPSVVVSPSMQPGMLELPETRLRQPSDPGFEVEIEQAPSIHDIETGEVDPLMPETTELPPVMMEVTAERTSPHLRVRPVARQRMIAVVVFIVLLGAIGVGAMMVVIHVGTPPPVGADGALVMPDLPPPPDQSVPDLGWQDQALPDAARRKVRKRRRVKRRRRRRRRPVDNDEL